MLSFAHLCWVDDLSFKPPRRTGFRWVYRYGDLTHELAFTAGSISQALRSVGFGRIEVLPVERPIHGLRASSAGCSGAERGSCLASIWASKREHSADISLARTLSLLQTSTSRRQEHAVSPLCQSIAFRSVATLFTNPAGSRAGPSNERAVSGGT